MFDFLKNAVSGLMSPLENILGQVVTDKDQRNKLLQEIKMTILDHMNEEMQAKRDIIVAEAKSDSWLTRSWRPITMLTFLVLLISYWFGLTADYVVASEDVVTEVFRLLKIGIGGYIGSRGAEKVADSYFKAKKSD